MLGVGGLQEGLTCPQWTNNNTHVPKSWQKNRHGSHQRNVVRGSRQRTQGSGVFRLWQVRLSDSRKPIIPEYNLDILVAVLLYLSAYTRFYTHRMNVDVRKQPYSHDFQNAVKRCMIPPTHAAHVSIPLDIHQQQGRWPLADDMITFIDCKGRHQVVVLRTKVFACCVANGGETHLWAIYCIMGTPRCIHPCSSLFFYL